MKELYKLKIKIQARKTKFVLTRFGGNFGTLRLNEKSFLNTLVSFGPYWGKKPTNVFMLIFQVYTLVKKSQI